MKFLSPLPDKRPLVAWDHIILSNWLHIKNPDQNPYNKKKFAWKTVTVNSGNYTVKKLYMAEELASHFSQVTWLYDFPKTEPFKN